MLLKLSFLFSVLLINVIDCIDLDEGDKCEQSTGENGLCLLATNCKEAVSYIKKRQRHPFKRCGFEGSVEIVCCPQNEGTGTNKPSKPTEVRNGSPNSRLLDKYCKTIVAETLPPLHLHIVGGEDAQLGEFPHMAALGYLIESENKYDFSCGGSLISDSYIVTAAHCIDNVQQISPSIARLGVVELGGDVFNSTTDIRISQTILHPERKSQFKYHDLALLKLEKPAEYSVSLAPACVYTERGVPAVPLAVTGWGKISVTKDIRGKTLQKGNVTSVPNDECGEKYQNWRKLPQGISEGQFCAGDPQGRTDACQGDSGGPIQALTAKDGHYRIIGITSFGSGCGSTTPGVYTRIYHYLDWLESVIWPNGF